MKICENAKSKRIITKREVLFSFSCNENVYYILKTTKSNFYECIKARWNFFQGWHHIQDEVETDILKIATRICMLGEDEPKRFAMSGEHYCIVLHNESSQFRFRILRKTKSLLSVQKVIIPLLFQTMLSLLFSGLMYYLFADECVGWLSFIVPNYEVNFFRWFILISEIGIPIFLFSLFPQRRGIINLYFNSVLPIGLVVLLGVIKRWIWILYLVPLALVVAYILVVIFNAIFEEDYEEINKVKEVCSELRSALIVVVSVCVLCTGIFNIKPYTYQSNDHTEVSISEEELYEQFIDACCKIQGESFQDLSTQAKLDLLQQFCNYECLVTFGCEPPQVNTLDIEDEGTLGYYTYPDQTITIDINHLNDGDTYDVIKTLLHETRHHWQHKVVNIYIAVEPHLTAEQLNMSPFREAREYLDNYGDYQESNSDGFDAYYAQPVEEDARTWATKRMGWYASFIYGDR